MTEEREADGAGRERPRTAADRRGRRPASRDAEGRAAAVREGRGSRGSLPSRFVRFLREVVAELRKVIWPGRRELITYTTVVILFVAFIVALVSGLDLLFAQAVIAVFG